MINVFFIIMIFAELLASTSQILLKKSAQKEYPSFIKEYLNILVIGGYGLLVLSMVLSIFCYGGLGYMGVVVMEPMAYIMVMILSRIVFKEKITPRKIIGVVLILTGIVVFYTLG
ncbi:MAG: multidrug ABC transporter [Butyrivibrio sp.]|nr:multidrug ABC transporter [Butyrivibrio sp.]